ncbi:MAG: acetolactate synthase-1/2/3 large subunit [Flavobacteriales bacterium]|jgi:acetolactate synthase-1/2/3 large subunit
MTKTEYFLERSKKKLLNRKETFEARNADIILQYLEMLGVDTVFGVPGGAIEPLFNALARSERRQGIRLVLARHEGGAAFMADGYFRETGKLGVLCCTTGPGTTNAIGGICTALADRSSVLVISAQTSIQKFGRRSLQDSSCSSIDTVAMLASATKYSSLVSHSAQLVPKLLTAIGTALQVPCGPVHLSIPSDILNQESPLDLKNFFPNFHQQKLIDLAVVDTFAAMLISSLSNSNRNENSTVIYVAHGVGSASQKLMELIETLDAPFICEPTAKSRCNETHSLFNGVFGLGGHASATKLLADSNVKRILAFGISCDELGTDNWSELLLNSKLIHIDFNAENFLYTPMAKQHIYGDIGAVIDRCLDMINAAKICNPHKKLATTESTITKSTVVDSTVTESIVPKINISEANLPEITVPETNLPKTNAHEMKAQRVNKNTDCPSKLWSDVPSTFMNATSMNRIHPKDVFTRLSRELPKNCRVAVDAGNSWAWASHYYLNDDVSGNLRMSMGFGSMCWAIGAAIGSAIGRPSVPNICITGDGSYLMSAQEIMVAKEQHLPVIFLVLNDSALGMVKHGQRMGGQESIAWDLGEVDFAMMATAVGVESLSIRTPAMFDALDWGEITRRNEPLLIDLRIDGEAVPPIKGRVDNLARNDRFTPGS